MTSRVLKWPVAIDDQAHPIGTGPVVLVGAQTPNPHTLMVWTLEDADPPLVFRPGVIARAFGTGQEVPAGWGHVGSVITHDGHLVWHVFTRPDPS